MLYMKKIMLVTKKIMVSKLQLSIVGDIDNVNFFDSFCYLMRFITLTVTQRIRVDVHL